MAIKLKLELKWTKINRGVTIPSGLNLMSKLLLLCAVFLSLGVARAEVSDKSEVVVMATGGTIAGASADKSAVTGYTASVISAMGMDLAAITEAFETH